MTRDDIIRMAEEADAYADKKLGPGEWHPDKHEIRDKYFAVLVAAAERNKLAKWMAKHSYATGHGDTTEDLLKELEWQINERIDAWEHSLAEAIRERNKA